MHYPGWSASWDEWISAHSIRLTDAENTNDLETTLLEESAEDPDVQLVEVVKLDSFEAEIEPYHFSKTSSASSQTKNPKTRKMCQTNAVNSHGSAEKCCINGDSGSSSSDDEQFRNDARVQTVCIHEVDDTAASARFETENLEQCGLPRLDPMATEQAKD